jgi:hypothetical protein
MLKKKRNTLCMSFKPHLTHTYPFVWGNNSQRRNELSMSFKPKIYIYFVLKGVAEKKHGPDSNTAGASLSPQFGD